MEDRKIPTYDYLCKECGHTFEKMQAMSAKPLKKCPECKKNKLVRLIGAGSAGIVKGSDHPTQQGGQPFRPPIEGIPERIKF